MFPQIPQSFGSPYAGSPYAPYALPSYSPQGDAFNDVSRLHDEFSRFMLPQQGSQYGMDSAAFGNPYGDFYGPYNVLPQDAPAFNPQFLPPVGYQDPRGYETGNLAPFGMTEPQLPSPPQQPAWGRSRPQLKQSGPSNPWGMTLPQGLDQGFNEGFAPDQGFNPLGELPQGFDQGLNQGLDQGPDFASEPPSPSARSGGPESTVWGDPHFVTTTGKQFDVMGESGKLYNIVSDLNYQFNAKFEDYGDKVTEGTQPTVIGEAGLQIKGDKGVSKLKMSRVKGEVPTLNGQPMEPNKKYALAEKGSWACWDGDTRLRVVTNEYETDLSRVENHGDPKLAYLNQTVKVKGATAQDIAHMTDSEKEDMHVAAHGLLGQTFRSSFNDNFHVTDKQGTGIIEGSYKDYEVSDLFASDTAASKSLFGKKVKLEKKGDHVAAHVVDAHGKVSADDENTGLKTGTAQTTRPTEQPIEPPPKKVEKAAEAAA